jgi:hypothetical protein
LAAQRNRPQCAREIGIIFLTVASAGEFDEFDLNEFFAATGTGKSAQFKHKGDVQK